MNTTLASFTDFAFIDHERSVHQRHCLLYDHSMFPPAVSSGCQCQVCSFQYPIYFQNFIQENFHDPIFERAADLSKGDVSYQKIGSKENYAKRSSLQDRFSINNSSNLSMTATQFKSDLSLFSNMSVQEKQISPNIFHAFAKIRDQKSCHPNIFPKFRKESFVNSYETKVQSTLADSSETFNATKDFNFSSFFNLFHNKNKLFVPSIPNSEICGYYFSSRNIQNLLLSHPLESFRFYSFQPFKSDGSPQPDLSELSKANKFCASSVDVEQRRLTKKLTNNLSSHDVSNKFLQYRSEVVTGSRRISPSARLKHPHPFLNKTLTTTKLECHTQRFGINALRASVGHANKSYDSKYPTSSRKRKLSHGSSEDPNQSPLKSTRFEYKNLLKIIKLNKLTQSQSNTKVNLINELLYKYNQGAKIFPLLYELPVYAPSLINRWLDPIPPQQVKEPRHSSFRSRYEVGGKIGRGGGGVVYAGIRKGDKLEVAIKRISKRKVKRWGVLNRRKVPIEFELLCRAGCGGNSAVVKFFDWFDVKDSFILVMERPLPAIDMFDYLTYHGPMTETQARLIFNQLVQGVLTCHKNGVVHRDIKDENIILNLETSEAKIIDFGCGALEQEKSFSEFAGTYQFYPPEWFLQGSYFGRDVDTWSLGVLLYTMLQADIPFHEKEEITKCEIVYKKSGERPSEPCQDLIKSMLKKNPKQRIKLCDVLQHEWMVK